jgi:hypothetical protein
VDFTSTIQTFPQQTSGIIKATTFYVRADSTSTVNSSGMESQTGLANTAAAAFKTIQGAINTISANYISTQQITVRVGPGVFNGGGTYVGDTITVNNSYIASWLFIGDTTTPSNVRIDASSTSVNNYIPGCRPLTACTIAGGALATVQGFQFVSNSCNAGAQASSTLYLNNCWFTSNPTGEPVIFTTGGSTVSLFDLRNSGVLVGSGNFFSSSGPIESFMAAYGGAAGYLGETSIYGNTTVTVNMSGTVTVTSGWLQAVNSGTIYLGPSSVTTWPGSSVSGPGYQCTTGGGIVFSGGIPSGIPPSAGAGTVTPPGWTG